MTVEENGRGDDAPAARKTGRALQVQGIGESVCIGLYDVLPDGTRKWVDGAKVSPEQARDIAQSLTWESMEVEAGHR